MNKMTELQLDMACELDNFCMVCRQYHPVEEVSNNVCKTCEKPSDELRFSKMDNPDWCCECCLERKDVPVVNHVCQDCQR